MKAHIKSTLLNNLRAIIIHIVLCLISMIHTGFTWRHGIWWDGMSRDYVVTNWVLIGIFSIVNTLLYFWLGRKFLNQTHNVLTNFFSVAIVPIIILLAIGFAWSSSGRISMLGLLAFPIYPISDTISLCFHLEQSAGFIIMSPLPPIAM